MKTKAWASQDHHHRTRELCLPFTGPGKKSPSTKHTVTAYLAILKDIVERHRNEQASGTL
jgi:hypothetical protein